MKAETSEVKSMALVKKLNDYMMEENNELYNYLNNKKELKDFLINRSNAAFDAYTGAVSAGFPAPDEISNQILFCGMENSYREYIESLLDDNFQEFYIKLNKKPAHTIKNILGTLVFACMDVFYENISSSYDQVMDKLDDELIKILEQQTKVIKV